jgi:tRNA nucleotidyltransferase (CCA-adding enzyme)
MTADEYLKSMLAREAVDTGSYSPVRSVQAQIQPVIKGWVGNFLVCVSPSGSFAKDTANHSGTDIDLFISLSQDTTETLKDIYDKPFKWMTEKGYIPKRQNVSINVKVSGYSVDLVPARRQDACSDDHSLYRRKADTWTKANVTKHIDHVKTRRSHQRKQDRQAVAEPERFGLPFLLSGTHGHQCSVRAARNVVGQRLEDLSIPPRHLPQCTSN